MEYIIFNFNGEYYGCWLDILIGNYLIVNLMVKLIDVEGNEMFLRFMFDNDGDNYRIMWYCDLNNESRIFKIEYKILKGLKVYDDVVEFYWKVWGSGWKKELLVLWIEIELLERINDRFDVLYWLYFKIDG